MAAKEAQKRPASPPRGPALSMEDQKRLFQSLFFMNNADVAVIKGLVEKISNRWSEYPEFLVWAILSKKKPVVEFLLSDGASLSDPPATVTRDLIGLTPDVSEALQFYRRKPYILLAASSSTWEIVDLLLSQGESLQQVGFVGLSKTRLNAVLSNALGAAAFYDRKEIVEGLLRHTQRGDPSLEFRTLEEKTISKSKTSMVKEYTGCTPFLLSAYRSETPEVMQKLIEAGCSVNVADWQGNSALHITAVLNKAEHVRVLAAHKCEVMLARNQKGETPISLATAKGFASLLPLIGQEDLSDQAAAKLLDSLTAEEKKKQKRKSKKQKKKELVETSKQQEIEEVKEGEEKKEVSPPRPALKVVQLPPYKKPVVAEKVVEPVEPTPPKAQPTTEKKKKQEPVPQATLAAVVDPPVTVLPPVATPSPVDQPLLSELQAALSKLSKEGALETAGKADLAELKSLLERSVKRVSELL